VVSYSLLLSVLEYQTAVMRQDFTTADRVLPTIPHEYRTRVAHFLEKQVCIYLVLFWNKIIFVDSILGVLAGYYLDCTKNKRYNTL